jgi:hypothetical protein
MAVVVALSLFALVMSTSWVLLAVFQPAPKHQQNVVTMAVGIFCVAFWIISLLATASGFLNMLLSRRTSISLDEGTVTLSHWPGWSRTLLLESVPSVALILLTDKGKGTCLLGLADNSGSVHVVHWLGGYQTAEEYRDELLPAARLLARFLDKPLESSRGRYSLPRWKKGLAPERIPWDE